MRWCDDALNSQKSENKMSWLVNCNNNNSIIYLFILFYLINIYSALYSQINML